MTISEIQIAEKSINKSIISPESVNHEVSHVNLSSLEHHPVAPTLGHDGVGRTNLREDRRNNCYLKSSITTTQDGLVEF